MPAAHNRAEQAAGTAFLEAFGGVSDAVESGAGLPQLARVVGGALDASIVILDASGAVLAAACASPDDERAVLAAEGPTDVLDLRVAEARVGQVRYRSRGQPPPDALVRLITPLIALEVDRSTAPERASEAAVAGFLTDLFERRVTDRDNIVARAHELGADLSGGASVIVTRAQPQAPEEGDWRARVLALAGRAARAASRSALAASVDLARHRRAGVEHPGELVILIPGADAETASRAVGGIRGELEAGLPGYSFTVARSRPAADPADLHRAGAEAELVANVAQARGTRTIAFEETGSYRLLLPAMSEDPAELQRFHDETVAPLVAYDEQYETDLVRTLETFLEADGNVAETSQRLFTHRHTVRYRLERVRALSGLDVGSSDGRERLSLGLKSMRVLGIVPPRGPAFEAGTEAGRVPPPAAQERR